MSTPQTWRRAQAQQVALHLHLQPSSPVCRLCRDDITRLANNPQHVPRWEKHKEKCTCCVPRCSNTAFVQSRVATSEEVANVLGCPNAPYPTPLCKHHYHLLYNTLQPTQTHCCSCETPLRNVQARTCPDPQRIQQYLEQETGFEGTITSGAWVCTSCYKAHLQVLKEVPVSTDSDLIALIDTLKASIFPIEVKSTYMS